MSIFDQVRPVLSHLEVCLPEKPITSNNIGESLKGPKRPFWKEYLFVQYDKNQNVNPLLNTIQKKYLPDGKKVPRSLIDPSVEEGDCSDAWKFVARHCTNGSYQIPRCWF